MKKMIPLKVQFACGWIPYVNGFTQAMFFYNCIRTAEAGKHLRTWFLRTIPILLLFAIADICIRQLPLAEQSRQVWKCISTYLTGLMCSLNVYCYQKKTGTDILCRLNVLICAPYHLVMSLIRISQVERVE